MEIKHSWYKEEKSGAWWVKCIKKDKLFIPDKEFNLTGRCPYCGEDALKEMEMRKRVKKEIERQEQMKEELKKRNTLKGYL